MASISLGRMITYSHGDDELEPLGAGNSVLRDVRTALEGKAGAEKACLER